MKTQLILSLYDALICGKKISRAEFCKNRVISERTFYRYIKEIGLFLMHVQHSYILKECEPEGVYYFEKIVQ